MPRYFPTYPGCAVCGDPDVNPSTLAMRWRWHPEDGSVRGTFLPSARHAGYQGQLHGGIIASLFDECLGWAAAMDRRSYFVTGELTVRFKRPVAIGDTIELVAKAGEARGPYARATGEARSAAGGLLASAQGLFRGVSRERALEVRRCLRFQPGDLDVLDDGSGS